MRAQEEVQVQVGSGAVFAVGAVVAAQEERPVPGVDRVPGLALDPDPGFADLASFLAYLATFVARQAGEKVVEILPTRLPLPVELHLLAPDQADCVAGRKVGVVAEQQVQR